MKYTEHLECGHKIKVNYARRSFIGIGVDCRQCAKALNISIYRKVIAITPSLPIH